MSTLAEKIRACLAIDEAARAVINVVFAHGDRVALVDLDAEEIAAVADSLEFSARRAGLVTELRAHLADAAGQIDSLRAELDDAKKRIAALRGALEQCKESLVPSAYWHICTEALLVDEHGKEAVALSRCAACREATIRLNGACIVCEGAK